MRCNGCRILRKGCSEGCILRPCLQWIESPDAQAHATLFVAKFFGRADLMSFISAVPNHQRPALFQSLLFEACGRTVNPVMSGAVGLLSSGNWHICQSAMHTVLCGGIVCPIPPELLTLSLTTSQSPQPFAANTLLAFTDVYGLRGDMMMHFQPSDFSGLGSEMSGTTTNFDDNMKNDIIALGGQNRKVLNLFV